MASIPSNGYAEVMSGTNNYSGSNSFDGSCPRTAIPPVIGNDLTNKTYVDNATGGGIIGTLTDKGSLITGDGTQAVIFDQNPYQTALTTTTVYDWNSLALGQSRQFTTTVPTLIPLGAEITITYSGTDSIKGNITAVAGSTITITISALASAGYASNILLQTAAPFGPGGDVFNGTFPFNPAVTTPNPPNIPANTIITDGQGFISTSFTTGIPVSITANIIGSNIQRPSATPFTTIPFDNPTVNPQFFNFPSGCFVGTTQSPSVQFFGGTYRVGFPSGGTFAPLNYVGFLSGYTVGYSTGSIVIDDDIALIADATSVTGLAWGVINTASIGAVTSVSGGVNIVMSGTIPAPVVNLRNPLTAELNMGSQSLRDSANAVGTSGQVLSCGTGGQTLWAASGGGNPTITDTNTNATFFPTFVAGVGTQALLADVSTGAISLNPSNGNLNVVDTLKLTQTNVAVGKNAGLTSQSSGGVAIGLNAGTTTQGSSSVAIGTSAGNNLQNVNAVAIGTSSGQSSQNANSVSIGNSAGQTTQGAASIAIGIQAGQTTQGSSSIAIGGNAGQTSQSGGAVAIGNGTGTTSQGVNSVALGAGSGAINQSASCVAIGSGSAGTAQGASSVAIGLNAGQTTQGASSIAIGVGTGLTSQGTESVAIGFRAGEVQGAESVAIGKFAGFNQGAICVAIGDNAGSNNQGTRAISIGQFAGQFGQQSDAIAIGDFAGQVVQSSGAISIGKDAGRGVTAFPISTNRQGVNAVAIGTSAGQNTQGAGAVSIGVNAGQGTTSGQGDNSIAIGNNAGVASQTAGSICLNATGVALNPNQAGLFINPIRNVDVTDVVGYNPTTKEVTYFDETNLFSVGTPTAFSPVLSDAGGNLNSGAYNIRVSNFVKMGKLVFYQGSISITAKTGLTGANALRLSIPFISENTADFFQTFPIGRMNGMTTNIVSVSATITPNADFMLFFIRTTASSDADPMTVSNVSATWACRFGGFYLSQS